MQNCSFLEGSSFAASGETAETPEPSTGASGSGEMEPAAVVTAS